MGYATSHLPPCYMLLYKIYIAPRKRTSISEGLIHAGPASSGIGLLSDCYNGLGYATLPMAAPSGAC